MSTHTIEVIELGEIRPHDNAEKMELTNVWGWQCCIGKGQFVAGSRAVYIPPDYLVPTARAEFAFLRKEGRDKERIRVRRLRGQLSQGLLIGLPAELSDAAVGTNVMEYFGIERYEPPEEHSTSGNYVSSPSGLYCPKFDVETYQRYSHVFTAGEEVIVTEKIHGANARYVYAKDGEGAWNQYCGSRTNWMAQDTKNIWWQAFDRCPAIGEWCRANPEMIVYGEAYGQVQGLKYGAGKNDIFFAAFAVLDKQTWVSWETMHASLANHGVPMAPFVYRGPLTSDVYAMAETDSRVPGAKHLAEGVVIVPIQERRNDEIGRVCLKVVSNRYLES